MWLVSGAGGCRNKNEEMTKTLVKVLNKVDARIRIF